MRGAFAVRRTLGRVAAAAVIGLAACGPKPLPEPPMAGPHDDQAVVVPYPPPPAKVDLVKSPPAEMKNPVWIDGRWSYRGLRWVWEPGNWTDWQPGDVYNYPILVRLSDGRLLYYRGHVERVTAARAE